MLMRAKLDDCRIATFYDDNLPSTPPELITSEQLEQMEDIVYGALLLVQPVPIEEVLALQHPPKVQQLIDKFPDLFSEPTTLPPKEVVTIPSLCKKELLL